MTPTVTRTPKSAMSRQTVCDFCERPKFLGIRLKLRGTRFGFVPGMLGAARYRLELCDDCYDEMVEYIERKTLAKGLLR